MLKSKKNEKLPKHKLKADMKTRWGSVFDMINCIMEQKEETRIVLASDRRTAHLSPT